MTDAWALEGTTMGRWIHLVGGPRLLPVVRAVAWPALRALDALIFIGGPLALLLAAGGAGELAGPARIGFGIAAAAVAALGIWTHRIEPFRLEVTRRTLACRGLRRKLRVVWLTDLQTDAPGPYERRALRLAMAARPDLLLLGGDYLHTDTRAEWMALMPALRRMLVAELRAPRLGAFAIGGNTDRPGWPRLFRGTAVRPVDGVRSFDLGGLRLTLLPFRDSLTRSPRLPLSRRFHLVAGHCPNYALGSTRGDLLLAGHTHGGQVRLPLIGPLVTMSRVPRGWAAGLTELGGGRRLLVSRGVGMDRRGAPRVRLLCRPEIAVLDLVPVR